MKKQLRFKGLSNPERSEIAILLKRTCSMREIAQALGRSPNTISYELKHNSVNGIYDPRKAKDKSRVARRSRRFQWQKIEHHPKVLKHIREVGINTPVIVLSGESGLVSEVDLLDNGANDYITKLFSLAELKARIIVLVRNETPIPSCSVLVSGSLTLDPQTRQVSRNGNTIDLRNKEFALLECLLRNAGIAISRIYLANYVWGEQANMKTNSIDVHINSLRDKIDRGYDCRLIRTVHGLGYRLDTVRPQVRI